MHNFTVAYLLFYEFGLKTGLPFCKNNQQSLLHIIFRKFMKIPYSDRKKAFVEVGNKIGKVLTARSFYDLSAGEQALYYEIDDAVSKNPWFTPNNVRRAMEGIRIMLDVSVMDRWLEKYALDHIDKENHEKIIAVIMAGNIPFVGFHDMLCVLLSGHKFLGKLSSQDKYLPAILKRLILEVEPRIEEYIQFSESVIKGFDAVIATGSNNSARYFNYYFGKYPHIIRRNRSSLAILTGEESTGELEALSYDIFQYFGMGCRNVSKLLIPKDYGIEQVIASFLDWSHLKDHYKFFNNYEYQKAVMLVNKTKYIDTGFCLLVKDDRLVSPLAVLYYDEYADKKDVIAYANRHEEEIQCVVSRESFQAIRTAVVPPGESQKPMPWDYADGVDTISFLLSIE